MARYNIVNTRRQYHPHIKYYCCCFYLVLVTFSFRLASTIVSRSLFLFVLIFSGSVYRWLRLCYWFSIPLIFRSFFFLKYGLNIPILITTADCEETDKTEENKNFFFCPTWVLVPFRDRFSFLLFFSFHFISLTQFSFVCLVWFGLFVLIYLPFVSIHALDFRILNPKSAIFICICICCFSFFWDGDHCVHINHIIDLKSQQMFNSL